MPIMLKDLLFLCIALVICNGCMPQQTFFVEEHLPSKLRFSTNIVKGRSEAAVMVENSSVHDVVCRFLTMRIISDDPSSYLELSEHAVVHTGLYLREGDTFRDLVGVQQLTPTGVKHIRSASVSEQLCDKAKLIDFCEQGAKLPVEKQVLQKLGTDYKVKDCSALSSVARWVTHVDLTGVREIPVRPLVFMPQLTRITMDEGSIFEQADHPMWRGLEIALSK